MYSSQRLADYILPHSGFNKIVFFPENHIMFPKSCFFPRNLFRKPWDGFASPGGFHAILCLEEAPRHRGLGEQDRVFAWEKLQDWVQQNTQKLHNEQAQQGQPRKDDKQPEPQPEQTAFNPRATPEMSASPLNKSVQGTALQKVLG